MCNMTICCMEQSKIINFTKKKRITVYGKKKKNQKLNE